MWPFKDLGVKHDAETIVRALPGWCDDEKMEYLAQEVLARKPKIAVEIGVYGGKSLSIIGLAMYAVKGTAECHAYGIDPWDVPAALEGMKNEENKDWWANKSALEEVYQLAKQGMTDLWIDDRVTLIRDTSENAVTRFANGSIGLLHIDGNHSAEPAMRDGVLYLPKVEVGGTIICDDAGWSEDSVLTVKPMIDYLCANGCVKVSEMFGNAILRKVK